MLLIPEMAEISWSSLPVNWYIKYKGVKSVIEKTTLSSDLMKLLNLLYDLSIILMNYRYVSACKVA